jgi:hypothetical protein
MHGAEFTPIPVDGEPVSSLPRVTSVDRTAELLGGITPRQVRNMIKSGELDSIKVGSRRMVLISSIDAYIDEAMKTAGLLVSA